MSLSNYSYSYQGLCYVIKLISHRASLLLGAPSIPLDHHTREHDSCEKKNPTNLFRFRICTYKKIFCSYLDNIIFKGGRCN